MLTSWILYTPLETKGLSAAYWIASAAPPKLNGPLAWLLIIITSVSSQLVVLQVSFFPPSFDGSLVALKDI